MDRRFGHGMGQCWNWILGLGAGGWVYERKGRFHEVPKERATVFKEWNSCQLALLQTWQDVIVNEKQELLQDCIEQMREVLSGFTVKSAADKASVVKEAGQKADKVVLDVKATIGVLGIDMPHLKEAEEMSRQCNQLLTGWGMQTLMSGDDIMDETKGIALRGRLRGIYETHVENKEHSE